MSLRLQVNLIITMLMGIFATLLIGLQINNTKLSVRDEMEGSNVVASQLLQRVKWAYGYGGLEGMREFLTGIGRVRANEIKLFDEQGKELYRSPPPTYKMGVEAPDWFAKIVTPPLTPRFIKLPNGHMELTAAPSRAVLDGWDDLRPMLWMVLAGFVAGNGIVFTLMGRALKPLSVLMEGLQSIERSNYAMRLPAMRGQDGQMISQAFNRMAQSVQDNALARDQAQAATQALAENRRLTQAIQARIEEERGAIARELHDELGQQITAIKSAGMVITRHVNADNVTVTQAARLVMDCADQIYDGMHHLISRLRPLALDQFGLTDALHDLLGDWRINHPDMTLTMVLDGPLESLNETLSSTVFRVTQEAVNNALRHAKATNIHVNVTLVQALLTLEVTDNGVGQLKKFRTNGHFGILGMQERVQALGGDFLLQQLETGGTRIFARMALVEAPPKTKVLPL